MERIKMCDIENFKYLLSSQNLKTKLEKIYKTFEKESDFNIYSKCQAYLEYINITFLANNFKIYLSNSNIMNIIQEYMKIDNRLCNEMLSINAIYEEFADNPDLDDIEYLLFRINNIYGYMIEKYKGI